jgi:hypothetical protein
MIFLGRDNIERQKTKIKKAPKIDDVSKACTKIYFGP